jgi:hypothetical protein
MAQPATTLSATTAAAPCAWSRPSGWRPARAGTATRSASTALCACVSFRAIGDAASAGSPALSSSSRELTLPSRSSSGNLPSPGTTAAWRPTSTTGSSTRRLPMRARSRRRALTKQHLVQPSLTKHYRLRIGFSISPFCSFAGRDDALLDNLYNRHFVLKKEYYSCW